MIELKDDADDKTIEMFNCLKTVSEDDNFLIAILSYAITDKDMQKVIDFIHNGKDVSTSSVTEIVLLNDYYQNND